MGSNLSIAEILMSNSACSMFCQCFHQLSLASWFSRDLLSQYSSGHIDGPCQSGPFLFFRKRWAIPGLFFFIFVFSISMYNWQIQFFGFQDSNCGSLVSEATALPTEPPPLPKWPLPRQCQQTSCRLKKVSQGEPTGPFSPIVSNPSFELTFSEKLFQT